MGSFRTQHRSLVALIIGLLVAAACQPAPSGPQTPAGQATPGGRVIVGSFSDASVLQPVFSNDTASSDVWSHRIYQALIDVDHKTGEAKEYLATKWEVSADNKTLKFTLRQGVVWSDGTPFTGEDYKFTVEAVMRTKRPVRQSIFQDIVGAKDYRDGKATTISGIKADASTVTIEIEKPFCPALINMGNFGIIPKHIFGKYMDPANKDKNIDDAPENLAPPVSIGPFKFKNWTANQQIVLERNDRYWGGKPLLDEWVYKVVPDTTALVAALKTGEIDYATGITPENRDDLKAQAHLNFYSWLSPGYTYIGWNLLRGGKEFLQSKSVRQALAYGINMDSVIERILLGEGKRMVAHHPPVHWAYDPAGLNEYKFDQAKSRQLLEADGWTRGADGIYAKGGKKLEFSIVTNAGNKSRETLLQVAVEQYKQIGVNVTARTESFPALVQRLTQSKDPTYGAQGGKDFDAVIIGWALGAEPDPHGIWHSSQSPGGNNFIVYKNPQVDKLIEDGRTKCSQAERKAAYKEFNKVLNEEQPYNFGFAGNTLAFANKKIQGIEPGSFSRNGMWNIEKWWIKQ